MPRAKRWCATWFPIVEDDCSEFDIIIPVLGELQYLKGQLERCDDTHRLHWQLYFETKRACSMQQAIVLLDLPAAHLSPARNITAAQEYVFKDDTRVGGWERIEEGTPSLPGDRNPGLQELITAAQSGVQMRELALQLPVAYARYSKGLKDWKRATIAPRSQAPKVYVLLGDSGSGKSSYVRETIATLMGCNGVTDVYNKPDERWWTDQYTGQPIVIVEDFDGTGESLKAWLSALDRYHMEAPIKGGFISLADMTVCFTSTTMPQDWFADIPNWRSKRITEFARRVHQTLLMPPSVAGRADTRARDADGVLCVPTVVNKYDAKWQSIWGVHDGVTEIVDGHARWIAR